MCKLLTKHQDDFKLNLLPPLLPCNMITRESLLSRTSLYTCMQLDLIIVVLNTNIIYMGLVNTIMIM